MPDQLKPSIVFDTPLPYCYTAEEVLALWPLIDEMGLYRLVMKGRLRAYLVYKDRPIVRPDGTTVYYGADEGAPHIVDANGERVLCWDYVRFNYLTVRLFQRQWYGEVLGPKEELHERELAECNHPALIYSDDVELINDDEFSYPDHHFFVQTNNDIHGPDVNLFTEFKPVIDKFRVSTECEPSYSIPRVELDEWIFQCTLHELRTWSDVYEYTVIIDDGRVIKALVRYDVPRKIFTAKLPSSIVRDMGKNECPPSVIAYILKEHVKPSLTLSKIGELLHPEENFSQQWCIELANRLLDLAREIDIQVVD